MKHILTILGIFYGTLLLGQNCFCDKDSTLNEMISCDTITFNNHAKLFWTFNCDSSWLTFESKTQMQKIIFSLGEGLQDLTGRLGYNYIQEYKTTFLIQNNVISGCCTPPDFYLYDKTSGTIKKDLEKIIYYSEDSNNPFIIAISNSINDTSSNTQYNLTVYNIDNDKTYLIPLPKGEIEKALESTEQMYPEYLFDQPIINDNIITLKYYLQKPNKNKDKKM